MGLYSNLTESDDRIESEENLHVKLQVKPLHVGGKRKGDKDLSPMMRTLIGASAELDGNNVQTAKAFGVSDRSVANYRLGRTSHSAAINPAASSAVSEAVEKGTDRRAEAKEKAINSLADLFDGPISRENLDTLKPREAISAAKDLATVIDRVTPKDQNVDNRVQFVVFAPRQKEESEYETIDINAREIG